MAPTRHWVTESWDWRDFFPYFQRRIQSLERGGGTLLKKVEEQKKKKKGHNNNLSFTKYIISRILCKIKSYL